MYYTYFRGIYLDHLQVQEDKQLAGQKAMKASLDVKIECVML